VFPREIRSRVAVELASTMGWERYVGLDGEVIGMKTFGASAPLKEVTQKFGFTPQRVLDAAKAQIAKHKK
jgi:transketolase